MNADNCNTFTWTKQIPHTVNSNIAAPYLFRIRSNSLTTFSFCTTRSDCLELLRKYIKYSQNMLDLSLRENITDDLLIYLLPSMLWGSWFGSRKGIRPVKNWVVVAWLCVCVKVQIYIWHSWCHCHSLSLAPVNTDWFYLPRFTFLVPAHPGSPGQNPRR